MSKRGPVDPETGLSMQLEKFAQFIAQGDTLTMAARKAGYEGHAANASRRAGAPKVKRRIEQLRKEYQKNKSFALEQAQKEIALETAEVDRHWIITEAKKIIDDSRQAKPQVALDALKFISELTGYTSPNADPRTPNKGTLQPHGLDSSKQINVQVLNQFTERLADENRDELKARAKPIPLVTEDPVRSVPDDGTLFAVECLDDDLGEDPSPVHEPAGGGCT